MRRHEYSFLGAVWALSLALSLAGCPDAEGEAAPTVCDRGEDDCADNATCFASVADDFVCVCNPGFVGDGKTCETDAGDVCAPNPCQNGGTCSDVGGAAACACPAGFTGDTCETAVADPCDPNPCDNGGTCGATSDGFICSCPPGFGGTTCSDAITGCDPNPCLNGGTCDDASGVVVCTCPAGFEGNLCELPIDNCAPNPCVNGGTCTSTNTGFTCDCPSGFGGLNCETTLASCDPNPCANGGTCDDSSGAVVCQCAPGYEGSTCAVDTDDCAGSPCMNGATCFDLVDDYFCDCLAGYSGAMCETDVDDCAGTPCANGGTCVDEVDGFSCTCAAGFEGGTCAININDCPQDPLACGNGYCEDGVDGYTCVCQDGWTGDDCTTDIDECATDPCAALEGCVNSPGGFACHPVAFVRKYTTFTPPLDGSSWENAYYSPEDAIAAGEKILWISAGTFESFELSPLVLSPDVHIYGGFDPNLTGTEGDVATRDLTNNVTTLAIPSQTSAAGGKKRAIIGAPGIRLDGLRIEGGAPDDLLAGGAVLLHVADGAVIVDVTFANNGAKGGGGAIGCLDSDNVTLRRVEVTNNSLPTVVADGGENYFEGSGGGGLRATNCVITVEDSTFTGNSATNRDARGGAIFTKNGRLTIIDTAFVGNTADGWAQSNVWGGAIYAEGTDLLIQNATFDGNVAIAPNKAFVESQEEEGNAYGGAIYVDTTPTAPWTGVVLTNNTAQAGDGRTPSFDCVPTGGPADGGDGGNAYGGGLFVAGGATVTMTGGQVLDNSAFAGDAGVGGAGLSGSCEPGTDGVPGVADGGGGYSPVASGIVADVTGADATGNVPNLWAVCPDGFTGYACDVPDP